MQRHPDAGGLLGGAAVDGVDGKGFQLAAHQVLVGQFQGDRDVLCRQARGQQQAHPRVGDRHRAHGPAAAGDFQLAGLGAAGNLGPAGPLAEGVVQQGGYVGVFIGFQFAVDGGADQPHPVLFRQADVAVPGDVGVAGLGPQDRGDIIPAAADPQRVVQGEVPGHGLEVGGFHHIDLVPGNQVLKSRLAQCPA